METEEDSSDLTVVMLHREACDHGSVPQRLLPELLAMAASYLDETSLIIATLVCRHWHEALISSPSLWSHPTFKNEKRGLVFMERSKSVPVSVDLDFSPGTVPTPEVVNSLGRNSNKIYALRAAHFPFLNEVLAQPFPILETLEIITSGTPGCTIEPSVAVNIGRLTNFRFELILDMAASVPRLGDILLDFLRGCPQLEVAFFYYGDRNGEIEFTADEESAQAVCLPCLRSFTHISAVEKIDTGLFDRLILPSTCDVAFTVTVLSPCNYYPWKSGFPTLIPDQSGVEVVKIWCHMSWDKKRSTLGHTFKNPKKAGISFNILSTDALFQFPSGEINKFLYFLIGSERANSVKVLSFDQCPTSTNLATLCFVESLKKFHNLRTLVLWQCNVRVFLGDPSSPTIWCPQVEKLVICPPLPTHFHDPTEFEVLKLVREMALSRACHGNPLRTLILYSQQADRRWHSNLIEWLRNLIGTVEVIGPEVWRR